MPYRKISSLPDSVKNHLPVDAQKIYLKAFNSAFEAYGDPSKRREDADLEETACRIAWSAVKKKYKKNDSGQWVRF